ncbi:MAG: GIY-YIG nuclease family protein [Fidelibacterota bacterium]
MYYTYILYSKKVDRYYVGYTSDLEERLKRHHDHKISYTSNRGPWKLVWYKAFDSKSAAYACERSIKKMKSRKYIETLIRNFKQEISSSSVH